MNLSTKTRYGSRAMAELAAVHPAGSISVKDIARTQQLSAKYLEKIMSALKNAGLVRSVRGTRGGYTLSREPADINLADVYRVFEGSTAPVECVDCPTVCSRKNGCPTRETWAQVKKAISEVLEGTTLETLAGRMKVRRS